MKNIYKDGEDFDAVVIKRGYFYGHVLLNKQSDVSKTCESVPLGQPWGNGAGDR